MTQEQVYEEVLKGLKNKKSIIYTLKRLKYASSTFYKLLTEEQKNEISGLKKLNSKQCPKSYGIPNIEWEEIEEFFKDEENHPDMVQISI